MTLPLAHLRVLDLSRALAGPFCTMILGDLGADIVKVEPLPDGEMSRTWGPFDRGISVYNLSVNRNKRSLALNFRDKSGLELLRAMALKSDILVENFRPGVMQSMGLDYSVLRKDNPGLIYAGITGMGREGPYGKWPGVDQIAQGMSGLMSITGYKETGPTRVGVPIGDLVAGMWTAIGIQAAVIARANTGEGQRVETSLLAALVGLLCVQGQRVLSLGDVPEPAGNDHPVIWPCGTFQASDGPFNMCASTQEMWAKLCALVGLPELIRAPEFADVPARVAHREELRSRLSERFLTRPRMEWTRELVALGIPAGPVLDIGQMLSDPHVIYNHLAEEIEHPVLGPLKLLANPIKMDAFGKGSVRTAPPLVGEHSDAILRDYGFSADRIAAWKAANVVRQHEGNENVESAR
jgi:crotonobetainyl-CoA:carnitine CoA-transferase CaiB-like acyl-CoA transferase